MSAPAIEARPPIVDEWIIYDDPQKQVLYERHVWAYLLAKWPALPIDGPEDC